MMNRWNRSRHTLLAIAGCLVASTCASLQASHPEQAATVRKRPNILWIVGENFKLDFGCYGAKNVKTPNIDSLAARGVRYTHVFSTSPVCAPSRSAFMTGMYQTSTDTHNMRSHRKDDYRLPAGVRPLTHWLQDAGYFTANITHIGAREVGTGKLDLNFANEGRIYQSNDWSALKTHQPFFAQINMPEAEYDIYDRKSAAKKRVKWVGEEWHPQVATPENVTPPPYYPDHEITRQEWARYLNSASGMDVRIGWILDQLNKDGLADNTIVVFFADNGRLEARGIHWCWDTGLHVPMIIAWPRDFRAPRQIDPGAVDGRVISLLDLTATTLWMAGIDRPAGMQSRIFLGPRTDPSRSYAFSARDRIDETVMRLRSVRDKRFHYIRNFTPGAGFPTLNRYKEKCFLVKPLMRKLLAQGRLSGPAADLMKPFPREMLFDTAADPHEIHNLADSNDPDHHNALVRLRAALDTWITETGDRGVWPEPAEIVRPFEKEMHDWFGTPDWFTSSTSKIETYRGRGLSASWRKAADSRIERIRKAPLTVKVTNSAGKPVANAAVTIRMLRHQFTFGSAVAARLLAEDTADSNRYRQIVKENYNKIVFENDLKWEPWNVSKSNTHRVFRSEWTRRAFEWLQSNHIAVRGHYIAWAPLKPRQVAKYKGKPELLRRELWDHMADKVPTIGRQVTDWDVINHIAGWGTTMETIVGTKDIYVDIVKRARQLAPEGVELWVNEGQVLPGGRQIEAYQQVIRYLIDHGAAIDGIGFMGHFSANSLTPPERLYELFDQFAQWSPNLQITELDVNVGADEQLQADYLRDVMTIALSHPNMKSLMMWGFWEGRHWRPAAALYRRDWSMKPAGDVWRDLVYRRWWTNTKGTTNEQGVCTERGFLGDYEVVARVDGREYSVKTSLTKPGRSVTLVAE